MNRVMVEDLIEPLLQGGYIPGAPNGTLAYVDGELVRMSNCGRCRAHGLLYWPFHRGSNYRAFKVCRACGFVEEL